MALLMTWLSEGETVPLEEPVRVVRGTRRAVGAGRSRRPRSCPPPRDRRSSAGSSSCWKRTPTSRGSRPTSGCASESDEERRGSRAPRVRVGLRGDDVQGLDRRRRGRLGRRQRRAEGRRSASSRSKPRPTRSRNGCGSCTRSRSSGGSRPGRTCGRASDSAGQDAVAGLARHRAAHARGARRLPRPRHRDRRCPSRPSGHEGMIEFDRRRALKGHILELGVSACVEMGRAARTLAARPGRRAGTAGREAGRVRRVRAGRRQCDAAAGSRSSSASSAPSAAATPGSVRMVLARVRRALPLRAAAVLPAVGRRQAARGAPGPDRAARPRRPAHPPAAARPAARDVPADQARAADGVEQPARRPPRQQLRPTLPHRAHGRGRDAPRRGRGLGRGRGAGWAALGHAVSTRRGVPGPVGAAQPVAAALGARIGHRRRRLGAGPRGS